MVFLDRILSRVAGGGWPVTGDLHINILTRTIFPKKKLRNRASPHARESRTVLDSGFHAVDSGFRVPDSGFQHSGFRIPKRAGFHFFTGFNAFLRTSFSCSNLAILKDVVRRHKRFVFFFDLQNYRKKRITVP